MQSDTGHLVRTESVDEMRKLIENEYKEVPNSHKLAADLKLGGLKETNVSLKSGGKLSKLCAKWRKEKKAKRRMGKQSRKINRKR